METRAPHESRVPNEHVLTQGTPAPVDSGQQSKEGGWVFREKRGENV